MWKMEILILNFQPDVERKLCALSILEIYGNVPGDGDDGH